MTCPSYGWIWAVSIARLFVGETRDAEASAWIAVAQDVRLAGARAAAVSEVRPPSPFAESGELVSVPRRQTGDCYYTDDYYASFKRIAD